PLHDALPSGERRDDPDRGVGRPNRDPAAPTDLGVSQPVGQAEHLVGEGPAVPARNTVFREGDDARVLVARREIAQQTDDVPTLDQEALMVPTAATGCTA